MNAYLLDWLLIQSSIHSWFIEYIECILSVFHLDSSHVLSFEKQNSQHHYCRPSSIISRDNEKASLNLFQINDAREGTKITWDNTTNSKSTDHIVHFYPQITEFYLNKTEFYLERKFLFIIYVDVCTRAYGQQNFYPLLKSFLPLTYCNFFSHHFACLLYCINFLPPSTKSLQLSQTAPPWINKQLPPLLPPPHEAHRREEVLMLLALLLLLVMTLFPPVIWVCLGIAIQLQMMLLPNQQPPIRKSYLYSTLNQERVDSHSVCLSKFFEILTPIVKNQTEIGINLQAIDHLKGTSLFTRFSQELPKDGNPPNQLDFKCSRLNKLSNSQLSTMMVNMYIITSDLF